VRACAKTQACRLPASPFPLAQHRQAGWRTDPPEDTPRRRGESRSRVPRIDPGLNAEGSTDLLASCSSYTWIPRDKSGEDWDGKSWDEAAVGVPPPYDVGIWRARGWAISTLTGGRSWRLPERISVPWRRSTRTNGWANRDFFFVTIHQRLNSRVANGGWAAQSTNILTSERHQSDLGPSMWGWKGVLLFLLVYGKQEQACSWRGEQQQRGWKYQTRWNAVLYVALKTSDVLQRVKLFVLLIACARRPCSHSCSSIKNDGAASMRSPHAGRFWGRFPWIENQVPMDPRTYVSAFEIEQLKWNIKATHSVCSVVLGHCPRRAPCSTCLCTSSPCRWQRCRRQRSCHHRHGMFASQTLHSTTLPRNDGYTFWFAA